MILISYDRRILVKITGIPSNGLHSRRWSQCILGQVVAGLCLTSIAELINRISSFENSCSAHPGPYQQKCSTS